MLTGALYTVMVKIHEALKKQYSKEDGATEFSSSGKALFVGAERFKRMIFRALDYLPPGEISFADYGRAIIASDQASHPTRGDARGWMRKEFVRRCMAKDLESLEVEEPFDDPAVQALDLPTFVDSDWAAYDFANRNRELLRIPPDIPFRVRPRLDTSKTYYLGRGKKEAIRECLFKVSWDELEPNPDNSWFPEKRQITVGTTLAIDWETKQVPGPAHLAVGGAARSARPDAAEARSEGVADAVRPGDGPGRDAAPHRDPGRAERRPDARARHGPDAPHRRVMS